MDDREKTQRHARLEGAVTPKGVGGYGRRDVCRSPISAPDWTYWPAGRNVQRWQAVSLSLGLDPDSLKLRDDGCGMLGHGSYITPDSFPDEDTENEFRKRIDLLSALSVKVNAPLSQFVGLLGKLPMPPELAALKDVTPSDVGGPQKVGAGGTADDWHDKARSIADECFATDTANNCRDSLVRKGKRGITGGYAYRVMEIMQQRKIHGPRGLIDNPATIARDALQGDLWWANKDK